MQENTRLSAYNLAGSNFGRGMAQWERGEISGRELGVLKRRLRRAEDSLSAPATR
jgi:hypothetical protein